MNYERMRCCSSGILNGKQVPYHTGIVSLRPLGAALQQNSIERERKENVTGLICHCHPNLTPLHPLSFPGTEIKQVYWQAGLGAGDNNVGFVPRQIGRALSAATPTQQLNKPNVQRCVFNMLQSG